MGISRSCSALSLLVAALFAVGCVAPEDGRQRVRSSSIDDGLEGQVPQVAFSIRLYDSASSQQSLYDEAAGTGSFNLESGVQYFLEVVTLSQTGSFVLNLGNGVQVNLAANQRSSFVAPDVGNYQVSISASAGDASRTKTYSLSVSCDAAESAGFAVNAAGISVSGSLNRYTYSVSNPASGGRGGYACAWDFNGDGIRDSDYASCSQPVTRFSNHVYFRDVGLFVRDLGCNLSRYASRSVNLAAPDQAGILGLAPQVYIAGAVSSRQRDDDPKLNLQHLSTNPQGVSPRPVNCSYSRSGTFTVSGLYNYSQDESQNHGMRVVFSGLNDQVDILSGTGSIGSANARVSRVEFFTDEAADVSAQQRFSGDQRHCTGSITLTPINIAGSPCTGGQSGIDGGFTVQAQATFSCADVPSSTSAGLSVDIDQGSFYCEYRLEDSCHGGGGGGGGVPPIQL